MVVARASWIQTARSSADLVPLSRASTLPSASAIIRYGKPLPPLTTKAVDSTLSAIEGIDDGPVEAARAVGGRGLQVQRWGVLPQVTPELASLVLYRFEVNIRASAILGFVGAGGIGYDLRNTMSWGVGKYDEAAAIFILLFGTIVFFDQISSRYRNRLTEGQGA